MLRHISGGTTVPALTPSQYVKDIMPRVEGWLTELSARIVIATSELQVGLGVTGSVAEIGVHQGRLFILLDLLRRSGDRALAIDVFDKEELNIDRSGKGDRVAFARNLASVGREIDDVRVIADSSFNVSSTDIQSLIGPVRLFSVDGGHTSELARNDLFLANDSLARGGVAFVDDVFNWMWPGVSEGLSRCLNDEAFELVPLALTEEKLLMTHGDFVDEYSRGLRKFVETSYPHIVVLSKEFYGNSILLFLEYPNSLRRRIAIGAHPLYIRMRGSRIVEYLRPTAIRVNQRLP